MLRENARPRLLRSSRPSSCCSCCSSTARCRPSSSCRFQGPDGGLTFPMNGVSLHWFGNLFEQQAVGDFGGSFRALAHARADGDGGDGGGLAARRPRLPPPLPRRDVAVLSRRRQPDRAVDPRLPRHRPAVPACSASGPPGTRSGFGAQLTWTLPFGLLIMFAVFNRFNARLRGSGARSRRLALADLPPCACCR